MPREMQLQRLVLRDKITVEQAISRIHSQMAVEEICKRADVVLKNDSSMRKLQEAIKKAVGGRWRRE